MSGSRPRKSKPAVPVPLRPAGPTRREALRASLGLGALAGAAAQSCGMPPDRCAGGPAIAPATAGGGAGGAAATPAQLLGGIDTIVVVMLENRSFDHLLGGLRMDTAYPAARYVDGLTGTESNPDLDGRAVTVAELPGAVMGDPKHDWVSSRTAFNQGRNDGFVRVNDLRTVPDAMGYHRRDRLPVLYDLADRYVVCDRWFSSVMGPTWPNRFCLHAATAMGRKKNGQPVGLTAPPTVWERMAERCWTAKNYYAGAIPWYSVAFPAKSFSGNDAVSPEPIDRFFADAERGELPHFAIVDPDFQVNDAHPPHDLDLAEVFIASIHRALAAGPQWARSLLVVIFDEHGGFFDHVPPPLVPDPDPEFRRLGFRVPAVVMGPSVRRGAVISTPFDHVSILATLAVRYGIASLGPRMDAAADLSSCIDPAAVAGAGSDGVVGSALPAVLPPTIEVKASRALASAVRAGSQPEMERLAAQGGLPAHHVDRRSAAERVRAWLRRAEALEAVRVIG